MDIVDLLAIFSDPAAIKSLTSSQRLLAGLVTTALGMGITFCALIILQIVTSLLERLSDQQALPEPPEVQSAKTADSENSSGDEELVAAITMSAAMLLNTSASGIVIRNMRKIEDTTSAWSKAGIVEHMQNEV